MKSLPEELTIKFKDGGKDIEVSVGGTVFPFPVSHFNVTFTPENGADYSISAGTIQNKFSLNMDDPVDEVQEEELFNPTDSILTASNDVLTPDSGGVLTIDSDEAPLDEDFMTILNQLNPNRKRLIKKEVPNGYLFNSFKTVTTDEKAYTEDTVVTVVKGLLDQFADTERDILDGHKDYGVFKTIKKPTVVFEDGVLHITEKLGAYDKA